MFMLTSLLIALTAVALLAMAIARYALHPAVVFPAIWIFQILGLIVFRERFIPLSAEIYLILLGGSAAFVVGALRPWNVRSIRRVAFDRQTPDGPAVYLLAAGAVGICVAGQFSIFFNVTEGEDLAIRLVHARTLISIDGEDIYGAFKYGSPVAMSALLLVQQKVLRSPRVRAWHWLLFLYFLLATIALAVLSTGRGPIVFIFLLLAMSYILTAGSEDFRRRMLVIIASLAALMFIIFWIMGSAMGKADEDAVGALGNLVDYLFSSIPALSVYLEDHPITAIGTEHGTNTFRIANALLAAAGLMPPPPSLVQEFVPVPHLTNLYTIYLQFIQDFGWVGVFVPLLILGTVHGWLFDVAMRHKCDAYLQFLLVVSYLPLLQSVFQETHFSSLATWLQLAIIGWLLTEYTKRPFVAHSQK